MGVGRPEAPRDESLTRDQSLPREHRLRRRGDYLHCYRRGRRKGGRYATLFFVPNPLPHPRLGITASRKVAKRAVDRQRLKRRVREIYRRWEHRSQLPPVDLVVNLKPDAKAAGFDELRSALERQLSKLLPARSDSGGRRRGNRRE